MAHVITNIARALTMVPTPEVPSVLGPVDRAAIAIEDEKIAWIGREAELPSIYRSARSFDAGGRLISPGLIDAHTHLVFAGDRSSEFAMRASGKKYADVTPCSPRMSTLAMRAGDTPLMLRQ